MTRDEQLLRECIKEMLAEDFGGMGGDYAGLGITGNYTGGGMGGGMGSDYGDADSLYKIFVKPFTDVIGVAAGKTKELSQRGITTAKVAFESVMTTLIPILTDDYAEIFRDEQENISRIRQEYGASYQATWDAFGDKDVMIAAFMYRPDLFLTVQFAKRAPKVAAKLLSVLSGGSLDKLLSGIFRGGSSQHEGLLREENDDKKSSRLSKVMARLASNDQVKDALMQSGKVSELSKVGQQLVRDTLKKAYEQAKSVLSAKTLQELEKLAGKNLVGLEKLDGAPREQREAVERAMMMAAKKSLKAFYTKALQTQVDTALEGGLTDDHPFVKDHLNVIQKINAL